MTTELEDEIRQLVIDAERSLRPAPDMSDQKAPIQPHYGLYLKELARSKRPKLTRAEDYLRVVRAMRDPIARADLEEAPTDDEPSLERVVRSPLRLLSALVQRLPDTVVFIIESGTGVLTLFTLRGGDEPLENRVELERGKRAFVDAIEGLIGQHRDDVRRMRSGAPVDDALFGPMQTAGESVWTAMPASIRSSIESARTILFLPSAFGSNSEFPLELCRPDGGWLGTTHTIARLSSMRTLLELLSPNRAPSRLDPRAVIVRAADTADLGAVAGEIDAVSKRLGALGIEARVDRSPTVQSVREALDAGLSVMHHCGHGLAGEHGEKLPLRENEELGPHDFSQLSGSDAPLVYLSSCEVGRARVTAGGGAAGFSTRLTEKGAPAVIGCFQPVADIVAHDMADAFYEAAMSCSAGESLTCARRLQEGKYPPACWGAFAFYGDPNLRLRADDSVLPQTREITRRWDSQVGRHLALRSDESRDRALELLEAARAGYADLDRVADWLRVSFQPAEPELFDERRSLCARIAAHDAVAGCELRMLLAMEKLAGSYFGPRKVDIVFDPHELAVGLGSAKSIHDLLAWSAFAVQCARAGGAGLAPAVVLPMLREAVWSLECWRAEEPDAAQLLAEAERHLEQLHPDGGR